MRITTLYDHAGETDATGLSDALRSLYDGDLAFPPHLGPRPFIVGNFVQTVDGIVSLKDPGHAGGRDISGRNEEDAFIMGLLRCYADAVLVGEETFNVGHGHLWTPEFVAPRFADQYRAVRSRLGKASAHPLNVIVSGRGTVSLDEPLFRREDIKSLVLTTETGATSLRRKYGTSLPADVRVLPGEALLDAADIVSLLSDGEGVKLLLHEGGPMLFSSFLKQRLIDELFLTVAPHIAGRGLSVERPTFASHLDLPPNETLWGRLLSVRIAAGGHLFLRYRWTDSTNTPG